MKGSAMSSNTWERPAAEPARHPAALDAYGHLSYEPWLALALRLDHFIRSCFGGKGKETQDE